MKLKILTYKSNLCSFGENHLRVVWRGSLALGVIPALAVFVWRLSMDEPRRYKKDSMKYAKIPYMLILRRYGVSLAAISITWFIYDFITYVLSLRCEIPVLNNSFIYRYPVSELHISSFILAVLNPSSLASTRPSSLTSKNLSVHLLSLANNCCLALLEAHQILSLFSVGML